MEDAEAWGAHIMAAEASGIAIHPQAHLYYRKVGETWVPKKDWIHEGTPEISLPIDRIGYPGSYPGGY